MTTLTALCLIDIEDYEQSCDLCSRGLQCIREIIDETRATTLRESMQGKLTTGSGSGSGNNAQSLLSPNALKLSARSRKGFSPTNKGGGPSRLSGDAVGSVPGGRRSPSQSSGRDNDQNAGESPLMTLTAARKLEWILLYHQALSLYNQGFHEHVESVIRSLRLHVYLLLLSQYY